MKIHYKNDLCFMLHLKDATGADVGFPPFDWRADFYTKPGGRYFRASCINGICRNCRRTDDGQLQIVADGHGLAPGSLRCEFTSYIPDEAHADGTHAVVKTLDTDIELVYSGEDMPATAEIDVAVAVMVGQIDEYKARLEAEEGRSQELAHGINTLEADVAALGSYAADNTAEILHTKERVDALEEYKDGELAAEIGTIYREIEAANTFGTNTAQSVEILEKDVAATTAALATKQEVLADSADIVIDGNQLSVTERAKREVFIDMWNTAAGEYGSYNEATGFFELNGITDIGWEEANRIMAAWNYGLSSENFAACLSLGSINIRTAIPLRFRGGADGMQARFLCGNGNLERIRIIMGNNTFANIEYAFNGCRKLTHILGVLQLASICVVSSTFNYCFALEELQIKGLAKNISFEHSPRLSLASLQYMLTNATNTTNISITVHKDVYAKITDESNEEWHALLALAESKNISFAC